MKKLLLILFATFVNLMGYAGLNPYAYNLSSDWDATKQILTVNFKLNAHPNLDVTANGNGTGIQIFAVDRDNNNKMYYIHGVPRDTIKKKIDSGDLDYSVKIPINGRSIEPNECLPKGKKLTFAVRVQGVNSKNKPNPGTPIYTSNRPFSPHGVAVNNHQNSQDFGAVYVTECTNGVSGNATWGWLSEKGKSLLKYDPRLKYEVSYRKNPNFSDRSTQSRCLEPHRVVVSDDGRIFVSSYNTNSNGKDAVWELDPKTGTYTAVVKHNSTYGERVVAIDVKGTTSTGLYMLVCYYYKPASGNGYGWYVCEYSLGAAGSTASLVGVKCQYFTTMDYYKNTLHNAYTNGYYTYTDGFFDVAYGAKNETTVYMGLDYYINFKDGSMNANRTSLIYFNAALGTNNMYNYYNCDGHVAGESWGGAGLVTYLDHNGNERIASGRCQKGDRSESDGRIQVYSLNASNVPSTKAYDPITTNTRSVINDLAIDCAYNLYAVSFTDGTTATGSGTLLAVPMPYSGTVTTYCPTSNTDDKEYFILPERTELPENLTSTALDRIANNNSGGCGCNISLNRPMQADMFSTICLPFDLNISSLPDDHPYKNADILAFDDVVLSADDNGNILELSFVPINGQMVKNTPYLIRPKGSGIPEKVLFDNVTIDSYKGFSDPAYLVTKNNVTFWGMIPSTSITLDPENDVVLILVADNRLAKTTGGSFLGLRGFFYYDKRQVPANAGARIAERKPTPTSVINLNSEQVDVEKFLREGRVYIRMGETLYTITGEIVE